MPSLYIDLVYSMFSLYFDLKKIVFLVISHIGFEGGTLVLIASVPGHCLLFTFESTVKPCVHYRQKVNEIFTWELHVHTCMSVFAILWKLPLALLVEDIFSSPLLSQTVNITTVCKYFKTCFWDTLTIWKQWDNLIHSSSTVLDEW